MPTEEMIPTSRIVEAMKNAAEEYDWCTQAEELVTEGIGLKFRSHDEYSDCCTYCAIDAGWQRWDPLPDQPTAFRAADVKAAILAARVQDTVPDSQLHSLAIAILGRSIPELEPPTPELEPPTWRVTMEVRSETHPWLLSRIQREIERDNVCVVAVEEIIPDSDPAA